MNSDRIEDLLALAALGELTPAEQIELDTALDADPTLGADLAADLGVAARLQSALPIDPPPAARASVLGAIAGVAQDAPAPDRAAGMSTSATEQFVAEAAVTDTGTGTGTDTDTEGRRRQRWRPLAAATAVVILVVGGVIIGTRDTERSRFDTVAESSDAQRRTLTGTLDGTLDAVWSQTADTFVLVGTDIPVLDDDETYQLWLIDADTDADQATSVGTFQASGGGDVERLYEGVDPTGFTLSVTIEPAGGSASPTLPIDASA